MGLLAKGISHKRPQSTAMGLFKKRFEDDLFDRRLQYTSRRLHLGWHTSQFGNRGGNARNEKYRNIALFTSSPAIPGELAGL